jgi:starch-binding outer membrane protein, SusD/RagB family
MKFMIKTFLPIALILFTLASCKDILDIEPAGVTLKDDAIKNESDLKQLLYSCYTVIASDNYLGGRNQFVSDLFADQLSRKDLGGDETEIYLRNTTFFNGTQNNFYREIYLAIYRANVFLENSAIVSSSEKNSLEGQAYLIRGMGHFDAVRLWAQPFVLGADNSQEGIPLRLISTPSAATKSSVKEVYAAIIDDLKKAENLLPETNGNLPTKWSARACLARVYFQMNNFQQAFNYSDLVIKGSGAKLDSDLTKRFSPVGQSTEGIYTLITERDPAIAPRFGALRRFKSDVSLPSLRIGDSWYASIRNNPGDKRVAGWYDAVKFTDNVVINKYNAVSFDLPVIHLTEMILTRAESAAELDNLPVGIADVNSIMDRAYGGTKTLPATTAKQSLINAIRQERSYEMVAEGDRLHQLKRIGAKGEVSLIRGAPWNCDGMLLQYPDVEIFNSPGFKSNARGGCN